LFNKSSIESRRVRPAPSILTNLLVALPCLIFVSLNTNAAPELKTNSALSTAGYLQLTWTPESIDSDSIQYELQQSTSSNFTKANTIYQGPDQSSVISGLSNNIYYYRVRRQLQEEWSETVEVVVKHHSLTRAFGFFALGAFMFIVTTIVLLKGARRQQ